MSRQATRARARRLAGLLPVAAALALLAGCGSSSEAPPGSPQNPLVNRPGGANADGRSARSEAASRPATPSFDAILEQQQRSARPSEGAGRRTTAPANPCALVSKGQAQAILGARLLDPYLAPQGPTCVFRNRSGSSFATVAVEALDFEQVRPRIRQAERVTVAGRRGVCGVHGRPMLFLPLTAGRVLTIAAPCDTALRLARRAAPRLGG